MRLVLVLLLGGLSFGCSAHLHGQIIDEGGRGAQLYATDGRTLGLVARAENSPVLFMPGATVEVWGLRGFGRVVVRDWKVTAGPHGMSVWVGVLEQRGVQFGMSDRNSGAYYFFDFGDVEEVSALVGQPVLVEGYVDGPHRVRVLDYLVLQNP